MTWRPVEPRRECIRPKPYSARDELCLSHLEWRNGAWWCPRCDERRGELDSRLARPYAHRPPRVLAR